MPSCFRHHSWATLGHDRVRDFMPTCGGHGRSSANAFFTNSPDVTWVSCYNCRPILSWTRRHTIVTFSQTFRSLVYFRFDGSRTSLADLWHMGALTACFVYSKRIILLILLFNDLLIPLCSPESNFSFFLFFDSPGSFYFVFERLQLRCLNCLLFFPSPFLKTFIISTLHNLLVRGVHRLNWASCTFHSCANSSSVDPFSIFPHDSNRLSVIHRLVECFLLIPCWEIVDDKLLFLQFILQIFLLVK